jgi:hypothetical protein
VRRVPPAFTAGPIEAVAANGPVLSFRRVGPGRQIAVIANTSDTPDTLDVTGQILLSTYGAGKTLIGRSTLRANEAVILRV